MSFDTLSIIRGELSHGEKLLWSGRPKSGLLLRRSDMFLIPFSLLWGGFAFFWEMMALSSVPDDAGLFHYLFPLFGVPFVIVGVYLIFGRFIHDAMKRSKTIYALTNKRVIIIVGNTSKTVKSLQLATLGDVSYHEAKDRSGTIIFGTAVNGAHNMRYGGGRRGQLSPPTFDLIENVKDVYALYRQQQERLARESQRS